MVEPREEELVVKIYFDRSPDGRGEQECAGANLEQSPYVKPGGINYVSKERALTIMKRKYPSSCATRPWTRSPTSSR